MNLTKPRLFSLGAMIGAIAVVAIFFVVRPSPTPAVDDKNEVQVTAGERPTEFALRDRESPTLAFDEQSNAGLQTQTTTDESKANPEVQDQSPLLNYTVLCSNAQKMQGLSGQSGLKMGDGYLFVYQNPQDVGIWMKDMRFSIDIYWLDPKGIVIHKVSQATPKSYPTVFRSTQPAQFVVETAVGAVDKSVGQQFDQPQNLDRCI